MPIPLLAQEADPPDSLDLMNEELRVTATITLQDLDLAATDDALPADEFPNMEIMEEIDETSCDLCIEMDGMIISRDDPDYDEASHPAHINCRRILVGVGADETAPDGNPVQPSYERPSESLIEKHGHFMVSKEKYAPLRIIAQPEGRDFIATPVVDSNGKRRLKLNWRIPEYTIEGYEPPE